MINNAHGGKARPKDFLPYGREKQDVDDVNAFAEALGAKIGKRR